jgi:hypothetical protein
MQWEEESQSETSTDRHYTVKQSLTIGPHASEGLVRRGELRHGAGVGLQELLPVGREGLEVAGHEEVHAAAEGGGQRVVPVRHHCPSYRERAHVSDTVRPDKRHHKPGAEPVTAWMRL